MHPRVLAVSVVHALRAGYFHDTAIDKRPVAEPVQVTELGLVGDRQIDKHHGGADKAVYAYAEEDAAWWASQLGRDLPAGVFGDNLRTEGLDVTGALIGERWRIGDVLLEVRMPRTPCQNLSMRMGTEQFHVRFNASGRVGALLKVLQPGMITAGEPIAVVQRPAHSVSVARLATGPSPEEMRGLLDSGVQLAKSVRAKARRLVERAERVATQGD
jgi:MOSC domain-containing protein YiiM